MGVKGERYVADGSPEAALFYGVVGLNTCVVAGTLGSEATTGSVLALRYPLSMAWICHVRANKTAMS